MSFATVSVITLPDQFAPVNTDGLWFQLANPSYSQDNFSYVVRVESWGLTGSTNSLGQYKIPPRPVTGNGIFTPHKILKTQISNSPITPIYATGINLTYGSMVKYAIRYGFELDPNVGITSTYKSGTKLALGGVGTLNSFLIGDILTLQMDNSKVNTAYNGTCSITNIGTTSSITDRNFGVTQSAETGVVTNIYRIQGTTNVGLTSATGGNYTWNSIRQYDERWMNFGDNYILLNNTNPFLTKYEFQPTGIPQNIKPTRLGQYETIGFLLNGSRSSSYVIDKMTYYGWKDGSVVQGPITVTFSTIDFKGKFEMGVGPQNILDCFGTASVDMSIIDSYRIFLSRGTTAMTNIWRRIDRNCTPYEVIQLMFLNDLGSYEYWNFYRVSKRTLSVEKVEWKKQLDWDYQIGDRQQSVLTTKANNTYFTNSDWLSQYDYEFLSQLITSPEVYRIDGTYSIPIIITDNKWVQKTQLVDQIFNLTINYKDSFNVMTQNS